MREARNGGGGEKEGDSEGGKRDRRNGRTGLVALARCLGVETVITGYKNT